MLEHLFPIKAKSCEISKQLKSQSHYKKKIVKLELEEINEINKYKIPNDCHFLTDIVFVFDIPSAIYKQIKISESDIKSELQKASLWFEVSVSEVFDFDVSVSQNQVAIKPKWLFKDNSIPLFYITKLEKYVKIPKLSLKNICSKYNLDISEIEHSLDAYATFADFPETVIDTIKANNTFGIFSIKTVAKIESTESNVILPQNSLISKISWSANEKIKNTKFGVFFDLPGILTSKKDSHEYTFSTTSHPRDLPAMCAITNSSSVLEISTQKECEKFTVKLEINQIVMFKDNTLVFVDVK